MKKLSPYFDLSVLIPARNEIFLSRTIENVLKNIRGNTEIVVVLDGGWADPPIDDHERVTLIYHSESIGQRAATNEAARFSKAKYIMKLDAHCAVGEGFDTIMIEDMQYDITLVPKMYNLHAFDWVCPNGHRRYQGRSGVCEECGEPTERDMLWQPKKSPESTSMLFDRDLRFGYWGRYKTIQGDADLVETMSLLGACWMFDRERFIELGMLDEKHGSWGQMGTEIACKTWLSGGRLLCTKKTWFSHMFRTQGGDFGFPYHQSGNQVNKARDYSRHLWFENKWEGAKYPLSFIIDKFAPIPDWHDRKKGAVYYTDNRLDENISAATQKNLTRSLNGIPLVSVSLKPMDFGDKNIVLDEDRGILTMFKQILIGLEALDDDIDIVFFAEHDILYPPSHFDFFPIRQDVYYYNENVWKVRAEDGQALFHYVRQTSGLCAFKDLLIDHYRKRIKIVDEIGFSRKMGFEPGTHGRKERVDDYRAESWMSEQPIIDIRHQFNLTPSRWRRDQFRNQRYTKGWTIADEVPGWGVTKNRFNEFLGEI